MTTIPIQLFLLDTAFTNRAIPNPPFFSSSGGIAQLSSKSLSYFQTPYVINDPRNPTQRNVLWAPETSPAVLVDNADYNNFVLSVANSPSAALAAFFGIIDILAFNYNANTPTVTIDALIVGSPNLASYYQAGSLALGPNTVSGLVYESNNTTQSITCPAKVSFIYTPTVGGIVESYAITCWLDNATFLANYANFNIIEIIPPIDYNDLLNMSFSTTSATLANDASIASFNQTLINQAIQTAEPSGCVSYVAKVFEANNSISMAFNIFYTGQVPTFAAMRTAIRTAVESSGSGTPASWMLRIPELYVESRIYLIPIWDQKITSGSSTLYAGIASPNTMLNKAQLAMGSSAPSVLVNQYGQFLTAAYDLLPIIAVPDSITQPSDSLLAMYPTYQAYASTDPNFAYMSADAQAFATLLNTILPIAAGVVTNPVYPPIVDGTLTYISFTQNLTEFCVLTRQFYGQQLGVAT